MSSFNLLNYLGNCPICNKRLRSDRTVVIREKARAVLVEADCQTCSSSLLLTIVQGALPASDLRMHEHAGSGDGIVATVGMVTDLTGADARRLLAQEPLRVADVLALHTYLKSKTSK